MKTIGVHFNSGNDFFSPSVTLMLRCESVPRKGEEITLDDNTVKKVNAMMTANNDNITEYSDWLDIPKKYWKSPLKLRKKMSKSIPLQITQQGIYTPLIVGAVRYMKGADGYYPHIEVGMTSMYGDID